MQRQHNCSLGSGEDRRSRYHYGGAGEKLECIAAVCKLWRLRLVVELGIEILGARGSGETRAWGELLRAWKGSSLEQSAAVVSSPADE
jgi:hypothetical protein